jgi:hypothetical protein
MYENGHLRRYTDSPLAGFVINPDATDVVISEENTRPVSSLDELKKRIENHKTEYKRYYIHDQGIGLNFYSRFFEKINTQLYIQNWVGIENEYYKMLKSYLNKEDAQRNAAIQLLNERFGRVKDLLEEYLAEVCSQEVTKKESIEQAFESLINLDDVARMKKKLFFDSIMKIMDLTGDLSEITNPIDFDPYPAPTIYTREEEIYMSVEERIKKNRYDNYLRPSQTLILNFNYTGTAEKLYSQGDGNVINIHGELNSKTNPMIFGYGDELDDDYKEIEKTNNNDFLDNIKSIHYHNTGNYRRLLEFLQNDPYQVFIMGHSCGNSDRTLLNTIFEHENCISIKPFYHQWEGGDNYTDMVKNISRNFNNKQNMRDIVVNKEFCQSLVPCSPQGE